MTKKPLFIGLFGVAAVAGILLLVANFAAPEVQSTENAESEHGRLVVAPGWVEPASEERELSAELRGRLVRIHVDEGDLVRNGQVLAEINDADYIARVRQGEAIVGQRTAELEKLINGARQEERLQARAELREAEAELTNAKEDLARRQPLAKRGFTSGETLDNARADVRTAEARLEAWEKGIGTSQ